MKKWLFFALCIAAIGWWLHKPAAAWKGIPAAPEPRQDDQNLPAPFQSGDYTITPLARYEIKAVVLSRKHYRNDRTADLAPVDLALGWGPMSTAAAINGLTISQSSRWYEYTWTAESQPLHPSDIARNSANTHCLPADEAVRQKLLDVRRHDLVTLRGYLIEATNQKENYRWRSSLSRDDTGGGACEVFWITALESTAISLEGAKSEP